jgi:hypothetical protein
MLVALNSNFDKVFLSLLLCLEKFEDIVPRVRILFCTGWQDWLSSGSNDSHYWITIDILRLNINDILRYV